VREQERAPLAAADKHLCRLRLARLGGNRKPVEAPGATRSIVGSESVEVRLMSAEQRDPIVVYSKAAQRFSHGEKRRSTESRAFTHDYEVGIRVREVADELKLERREFRAPVVRMSARTDGNPFSAQSSCARCRCGDRAQRGPNTAYADHGNGF